MKRRVLERDILIQYYVPKLVIGGLVLMDRVNKLQHWESFELFSNIKQTTQLKTERELQRKKVTEKKSLRNRYTYSIF